MTDSDWIELSKLVEVVMKHEGVKSLETKIGILSVKIHRRGHTTHIDLTEVK